MAAYPTLPITVNSRMNVEDGRIGARATNGKLKVRRLYATEKVTFDLEHELTSAQLTTLNSFYSTNKDLLFDFTWPSDAVMRSCKFLSAITPMQQPGGWFKVYLKIGQE